MIVTSKIPAGVDNCSVIFPFKWIISPEPNLVKAAAIVFNGLSGDRPSFPSAPMFPCTQMCFTALAVDAPLSVVEAA
jgi:hypothetical protein